MDKRRFLMGLLTVLFAAPINALAALWNKAAFETTHLDEATSRLNITDASTSQAIEIIAPDLAENGAIVQVEIQSNIANTESITILVGKNPTPLIAAFNFSNGAMPFVVTRIKMAETSDIKVVVKAGNEYFTHSRNVVVLENGCG